MPVHMRVCNRTHPNPHLHIVKLRLYDLAPLTPDSVPLFFQLAFSACIALLTLSVKFLTFHAPTVSYRSICSGIY